MDYKNSLIYGMMCNLRQTRCIWHVSCTRDHEKTGGLENLCKIDVSMD